MKNEKIVVDSCVSEILQNAGRGRYSGLVFKINGSTTFIRSGDREFLAWSEPNLIVGASVEFAIDQFRAVRVQPTPTLPVPEPETKTELPLVEPEIEDESSLTAIRIAWRREKLDVAATE